jgi:hypothetical protein
MTAACSQDGAVRITLQEILNGARSDCRVTKVIETELKKVLSGFRFPASLLQQTGDIRQTERNADAWKSAALGHIWFIRISKRANWRPVFRRSLLPRDA